METRSSTTSLAHAPRLTVSLLGVLRDVLGFGSRGGRSRWARATQALVAGAAVVTLVVGVRTIFAPSPAGSVPYSATFPQALAVSTAERFAEAYYTWDESDTQAHADALADVMVSGVPRQAGWDGSGKSAAGDAAALGFSIVDASHAIVTVVVSVTGYSGAPGSWREGETVQQALSIPVQVVGPRTWVSGLPAAIGVPDAPQGTPIAPLPQDEATTSATRPVVTAFFRALEGSGAALAGERAERAPGLGGTLAFERLRSWSVHRSDAVRKTGTAVVQWETADGAALEQQYRVVVTRDGDTWNVSAVTAAVGGGTP
ncbi:conjugal transfer protein [Curtobacterium sp. MCBD17_032]|uniref:conjugal transfer protein n=1 Tax=Curtobacterium sp. MCBD17_032 TaxID=2175659 RepID=UPI0015E89846|nr:conjugal transfer protein [Curtobacterium sp. MCBD17_032]